MSNSRGLAALIIIAANRVNLEVNDSYIIQMSAIEMHSILNDGCCYSKVYELSRDARKPFFVVSDQSATTPPVQFRIKVEEELYYPCIGNKGSDQRCSYSTAERRLCVRICKDRFSLEMAHY